MIGNYPHGVNKSSALTIAEQRIPTLSGIPTGDGQIRVWCRHCREWHYHGWEDDDTTPDHRQAHCDESPFSATGYYIAPKAGGPA